MRLARILGAIGRGLISAGVIVLLFVAYQLWGTGLQHSAAQGDLGNEFEATIGIEATSDADSLAELAAASQEAIEDGQILSSDPEAVLTSNEDEGDTEDEGGSDGPGAVAEPSAELFEANFDEDERQAILAKLYPEPGEAFARIVIPAINVDQITVEGVSVEDLRKGPGHYQTTPNPGQAGNAAIAGHRTTYGAPFHRVDELNPGDSIFVTTAQGTFHYRVKGFDAPDGTTKGHFIVSPSDTWVLGQESGENLLTLTACHPKYSARQRIIVQAELVGEPVPTIPRDEAVELGPISIDSGSTDERASEAEAVDGDAEIPEEEQVVIGDDVAADDDDSVDADGNPIDEAADADADADDATDVEATEAEPATDEEAAELEADEAVASTDEAGDEAEAETEAGLLDEDEVDVSSDDIELTSAQTPFGDADDFGEGLNGDRTKIRPAVMWGIAGLFIWMASAFMGRRLNRKWTLYAVALAPFGLVLWSAFVNIDQALPSY